VQSAVYGRAVCSAYIDVRSVVCKGLAAHSRYVDVRDGADSQRAAAACSYEIRA
jgi:hypothetical protein